MAKSSRRVVLAALAGNRAIALAKVAAAGISGPTAMLTEASHSLVDTSDQVLLLVGQLTLAFRRDSTTDMIEDAIREITHALQKADGRIAYVYVLRRIGLTNQVADASDVRFGSLAEIVSRPRHVRSSPQSRHSSARVARPQYAKSGHRRRYQTGMPGALTGAKGELSQHYRRAPRRESRFARGRS